jgi:hypothetical protein
LDLGNIVEAGRPLSFEFEDSESSPRYAGGDTKFVGRSSDMALTTVATNKFFDRLYPLLRELDADPRTGPPAIAMLIPYSGDEYRS